MEHQTEIIELVGGSKLLVINMPVAVSFSFDIYVRSGYRFAPRGQYELPHLLEHLAFEGNRQYPDALAFKAEVEKDGAYFNAHTNSNYNQYEFVSIPQELERIIKLGLAQVFEPILANSSIEHEKQVITNELTRNSENFNRQRWYALEQALVGRAALPSLSDRINKLSAITADDLRRYHDQLYYPANVCFVLSGHFNGAEVKPATQLISKGLQNQASRLSKDYQGYALKSDFNRLVTKPIPVKDQALFMIKFLQPGCNLEAIAPLSILANLYNGGFSSRMMIKGRQRGLTYGMGTDVGAGLEYTGFNIWDQVRPERLLNLFKLAIAELMDLKAGNYSDSELERAKGYEIGAFRRSYQTPARYADWYGEDVLFGRELVSPEQRIKELEAVERADIAAAAQAYIKPNSWAMSLLVKKPSDYRAELETILASAFKTGA